MQFAVMEADLQVLVSSFAFKTGTPDANLVLDTRFLPDPRPLMADNPALDGTHDAVQLFIRAHGGFDQFFEVLKDQVVSLITEFRNRRGARVHFAFGCTAGLHRSVFVAEHLAAWLRDQLGEPLVQIFHREREHPGFTVEDMPSAQSESFSSHSESVSSSSCSTSPSSSQPSSAGSMGPTFCCTYNPKDNSLQFEEDKSVGMRFSLSSEDMGSVLASGLDNVKALRARRGSRCPLSGVWKKECNFSTDDRH